MSLSDLDTEGKVSVVFLVVFAAAIFFFVGQVSGVYWYDHRYRPEIDRWTHESAEACKDRPTDADIGRRFLQLCGPQSAAVGSHP